MSWFWAKYVRQMVFFTSIWVSFCGNVLKAQSPLEIFTNQANALLTAKCGFGVNAIPIYSSGSGQLYTAETHHILQQAANMAVASVPEDSLPLVFRPRYGSSRGTNYITGYKEETNCVFLQNPWCPVSSTYLRGDINVYGIPVVIGAKTSLPNFNEFSSVTLVGLVRKIELCKSAPSMPVCQTNQWLTMSITNASGVEFWNCSTNTVNRNVRICAENRITFCVSNEHMTEPATFSCVASQGVYMPKGSWTGLSRTGSNGFVTLLNTNLNPLLLASYVDSLRGFQGYTNSASVGSLAAFDWTVCISNCLTCWMIDGDTRKLLDYVSLQFTNSINLTPRLSKIDPSLWNPTNISADPTQPLCAGISNQIQLCLSPDAQWPYGQRVDHGKLLAFISYVHGENVSGATNMMVPLELQARVCQMTSLQTANSPYHFTLEDLVQPPFNQQATIVGGDLQSALWNSPCSLGGVNFCAAPLLSDSNLIRTNGGIQLRFKGFPFCRYIVRTSKDLKSWTGGWYMSAREETPGNFVYATDPSDCLFFRVTVMPYGLAADP